MKFFLKLSTGNSILLSGGGAPPSGLEGGSWVLRSFRSSLKFFLKLSTGNSILLSGGRAPPSGLEGGSWVLRSFRSSLNYIHREKYFPNSCVEPPTAPRPIPGMRHQSPADRVLMHVLEFLRYFPFRVDIEIVEPRLPETARILSRLRKV
jgi:hypothetical protein